MNVQVHRAVTDLTGVTGMAIVRAIVGGERDPVRLAMHARFLLPPAEGVAPPQPPQPPRPPVTPPVPPVPPVVHP